MRYERQNGKQNGVGGKNNKLRKHRGKKRRNKSGIEWGNGLVGTSLEIGSNVVKKKELKRMHTAHQKLPNQEKQSKQKKDVYKFTGGLYRRRWTPSD